MKPPKDVKVKEGESTEFVCELSKPDYKVTWMKADFIIPLEDEKYKQEADGTSYKLLITEASPDMAAEYTIVAGDNKATAKLTVTGSFISHNH